MLGLQPSANYYGKAMTEADAHGIVVEEIAVGAKSTLKGKRRRFRPGSPLPLDTLPHEWHSLLKKWLKRGGISRWKTLEKDAGTTHLALAESLLNWLLRHGWASVEEELRYGSWWPQSLKLLNLAALRTALGLPDSDALATRWTSLRGELEAQADTEWLPALDALDDMPVQRALNRGSLLLPLLQWRAAGCSGTRRDFALFARADTKDITNSEWNWLDETLDLAAFGVERHTPLLLIAAKVELEISGTRINLASAPDFVALTPATVAAASALHGNISRWLLVENRTSFERMARSDAPDVGVIWLPGYPPGWWQEAVSHLLMLSPASAHIACDPDPAGIAIALAAARLWQAQGLLAEPWKMSSDDLNALPKRRPLTTRDRAHLQQLLGEPLPQMLHELAVTMLQCGEKGEQEGYL